MLNQKFKSVIPDNNPSPVSSVNFSLKQYLILIFDFIQSSIFLLVNVACLIVILSMSSTGDYSDAAETSFLVAYWMGGLLFLTIQPLVVVITSIIKFFVLRKLLPSRSWSYLIIAAYLIGMWSIVFLLNPVEGEIGIQLLQLGSIMSVFLLWLGIVAHWWLSLVDVFRTRKLT